MNRTTKTLAATATGALALGLGLGVAGLASADPSTSPSPTPSSSAPTAPRGGPGDHHGRFGGAERGQELAKQLADKLGVDQAKVQTALRDYREANRPTTKPDPGTAPRPAEDDAALAKALATALDVDEAKVTSALAQIRTAEKAAQDAVVDNRLAAAVKDGTLTQTEADAVKKAADAGIVHVGRR